MSTVSAQTAYDTTATQDHLGMLIPLWRRLLRTPDVTPNSNFFDLGGDSLLALTLFLEIERETGRHLPITAIYDAPTVAQQVALFRGGSVSEFSPLVLLKAGNPCQPPLFIFHGVGGTVVEFATLGRLIDIAGEVYAVQAQGIDGISPPLDTVEAMADLYCESIKKRQPHGPYWLCGYSFGGVIAVEVARRLEAQGEKIGLLFMIDAYAHPITWPLKSRLKVRLRRGMKQLWANIRQFSPHDIAAMSKAIRTKLGRGGSASQNTVDKQARKRQWLIDRNPNLPPALLHTRLAAEDALYRYRPRYYSGDVVFLKAHRPDPHFPDDPKHVYRGLVRSLRLRVSPGSHLTIINEHAPGVASEINRAIHDAQSAAPESRH